MNIFQNKYENFDQLEKELTKEPYFIKIKKKDELAILMYDLINSEFEKEICKWCRGTIINIHTLEIVCLGFLKFFDLSGNNRLGWDFDFNNDIVVEEKVDGSFIKLYYYKDKWIWATNGCIEAKDAPIDNKKITFQDLINKSLDDRFDYKILNKKYVYLFELASPDNQIVVRYDNYKLYLLAVRNIKTYDEVDKNELSSISKMFESMGVFLPKKALINGNDYISFRSEEPTRAILNKDIFKCLNMDDDVLMEGVVIKDVNNNRIKIKTEQWSSLYHMKNTRNKKHLVKAILNNEEGELFFVRDIQKEILVTRSKIDLLLIGYETIWTKWLNHIQKNDTIDINNDRNKKKEFANFIKNNVKNSKLNTLLFEKLSRPTNTFKDLINEKIDQDHFISKILEEIEA